jgi:hypothetical protein
MDAADSSLERLRQRAGATLDSTSSSALAETSPWIARACASATALALAAWVLTVDARTLAMSVPDDACFYFKIGENAANGRGLTFDGIHPTNGVQPLWQALVVVVSFIGGAPETRLRAGLLLGLVILFGAWLALDALLRTAVSGFARVGACVAFIGLALLPFTNGMESSILVALAATLGWLGVRFELLESKGWRRPFLFGTVLGGVMLARLDAVFFGATMCGALLVDGLAERQRFSRVLARVTAVFLGATLVVAPYLVFNEVVFGAAMPISGALKSSFPSPQFALADLRSFGNQPILYALVAVVHLSLAWRLRARSRSSERVGSRFFHVFASALAGFVVLHFAHEALFMKWATYYWHFALYAVYAALVLAWALDQVRPRRFARAATVALAVVGMVAIAVRTVRSKPRKLEEAAWHGITYDAAAWARREAPEGARFAMKDPGVFALFSERDVLSLDGLVNDLDYQHVLDRGELGSYLDRHQIQFLVQHAFYSIDTTEPARSSFDGYETASMRFFSHLHGTWSEPQTFRRSAEVHRSPPYFDEGQQTILAIWDRSGDGPPSAD